MGMEFDWVKPKGRGREASCAKGVKSYRADYKDRDGRRRASTVFRLCGDTMKRARFVVGDRVQVGMAKSHGETFVAIRRVVDGGFKISSASKGKTGMAVSGHVKMSIDDLPIGDWPPEKVHLNDSGVLIMRVSDGQS